ncbi:hypothetical protein MNEG_11763, partial [Monoraphidium neglectum]
MGSCLSSPPKVADAAGGAAPGDAVSQGSLGADAPAAGGGKTQLPRAARVINSSASSYARQGLAADSIDGLRVGSITLSQRGASASTGSAASAAEAHLRILEKVHALQQQLVSASDNPLLGLTEAADLAGQQLHADLSA